MRLPLPISYKAGMRRDAYGDTGPDGLHDLLQAMQQSQSENAVNRFTFASRSVLI